MNSQETTDIYNRVIDLFIKEKRNVSEVKNMLITEGINGQEAQRIIDEISNRIKMLKLKRTTREVIRGVVLIIIGFIFYIESILKYENLNYIGLIMIIFGIFKIIRAFRNKYLLRQNKFYLSLNGNVQLSGWKNFAE